MPPPEISRIMLAEKMDLKFCSENLMMIRTAINANVR